MAEEIWYRGAAMGVAPARPGSVVHDYLDGTYYTDTLDVAYNFAGSRSKSDDQLPYVSWGKVDPAGQGRVLDLSSGRLQEQWNAFVNEPLGFDGRTRLDYIRSQGRGIAGENFQIFLRRNQINIDFYDIIIGPNYYQGGRQMCVRSPRVNSKIDDLFVPGAPPRSGVRGPSAPLQPMSVNLTYSVKGQANGAAMVVLFMIADAVLTYINGIFLEADVLSAVQNDLRSVRDWQSKYPNNGALLVLTFRRTVLNSDFMQNKVMLQAGDAFEYSSLYFAERPDEAAKEMARAKELVQGDTIDGPYRTIRRKQGIWIAPRRAKEEEVVFQSPVGKWQVKIGDWSGLFVFRQNKTCSWSDIGGPEHQGTWWASGGEFQWTYSDDPKGWERIFHAKGPLKSKVSGEATIKGVNHGYYTMMKQA